MALGPRPSSTNFASCANMSIPSCFRNDLVMARSFKEPLRDVRHAPLWTCIGSAIHSSSPVDGNRREVSPVEKDPTGCD